MFSWKLIQSYFENLFSKYFFLKTYMKRFLKTYANEAPHVRHIIRSTFVCSFGFLCPIFLFRFFYSLFFPLSRASIFDFFFRDEEAFLMWWMDCYSDLPLLCCFCSKRKLQFLFGLATGLRKKAGSCSWASIRWPAPPAALEATAPEDRNLIRSPELPLANMHLLLILAFFFHFFIF